MNAMQWLDLSERSDNIIACGDVHGEFEALAEKIAEYGISDATVVVAGDCGFGFEPWCFYDRLYRERLHARLEQANVLLLMVRGNHDDPRYFDGEMIDYPCMKTLPDYTVVHTCSHNILCIGGAVSVDRNFRLSMMDMHRMQGKRCLPLYWRDEAFLYDERELVILTDEDVRIDTVVTHSAPSFCPPAAKRDLEHFCAGDEWLADDIRHERRDQERLYRWLTVHGHPLHAWYYGHYHASATTIHDGTIFHLLDIMEMKVI